MSGSWLPDCVPVPAAHHAQQHTQQHMHFNAQNNNTNYNNMQQSHHHQQHQQQLSNKPHDPTPDSFSSWPPLNFEATSLASRSKRPRMEQLIVDSSSNAYTNIDGDFSHGALPSTSTFPNYLCSSVSVCSSSTPSTSSSSPTAMPRPITSDSTDDNSNEQQHNDTNIGTPDHLTKQFKHQMSDRQRRFKIKTKLQELTNLVSAHTQLQRTDQMSVISKSVELLSSLKQQVEDLSDRLKEHELKESTHEQEKRILQQQYLSQMMNTLNNHVCPTPATYDSLLSSLSGLGVSIARLSPDGKIIEANPVFTMLTGFSEAEIMGRRISGHPFYCSVFQIPTSILQTFSQVPVLDDYSEAYKYPSAINNDFSEVLKLNAEQVNKVINASLYVHPDVSPELLANDAPCTYSTIPFHPPTSVAPSLFASPFVIPLSACTVLYAADFTSGPASDQSFFKEPQKKLNTPVGHAFMKLFLNTHPNHSVKMLHRMQTKSKHVIESVMNISAVRNEQGGLHHFLLTCSPECRRFVLPAPPSTPNMQHHSHPVHHHPIHNYPSHPQAPTSYGHSPISPNDSQPNHQQNHPPTNQLSDVSHQDLLRRRGDITAQ